MTSTADGTELISEVEDRSAWVGKDGPPVDARRDARRRTQPVAVRADAGVPVATRQGVAAGAVPVRRSERSAASPDDLLGIAVAIELLHNAFLVHDDIADGSEMRRGRPTLAATYGIAAALNAGDGLAVVAGQVLRRATRRLDRDLADLVWARVRHDGHAHARRAGDRGRLAARQHRGSRARGLSPPDHAQDVLVHHHSPIAGRRHGGLTRHRRAGTAGAVRLSFRRGIPDPRRPAQPRGRRANVRQGNPRRSLRGQADAAARPSDGQRATGADLALGSRLPASQPRGTVGRTGADGASV